MRRSASIKRKTKETDISCELCLDGTGASTVTSGNAFMDHMLTLFAKHGLIDCSVSCVGDTDVDFHHSAEDIGICLGQALNRALADCAGIVRFGTSYVPMDESLARVCIDLSGRPNIVYNVELSVSHVKDFECDLAHDFFKAFTDHGRFTLHVDLLRGRNAHHSLEAVFKSFGRALSQACSINPRSIGDIPSSKGTLA